MLIKSPMFEVAPDDIEDVRVDDLFSTEEAPAHPHQTPLFAVDLAEAHIDPSEFPELPELFG